MNFDELQSRLENKISEGRSNPIGYGGGDLTGIPLLEAGLMKNPCGMLRWMADNSDYKYETFVVLSETEGWQGINVYSKEDGSLVREIKVRMGGGENTDPKNQIYINNRKILLETILMIQESLEE